MSGIIAQNVGRHGGLIKAPGGGGAWTLIQTLTSDGSDSDLSFTSGLDSTYDEYVFVFNNIHPETDSVAFHFNLSIDSGSNYNVTKTTTYVTAYHDEGNTSTNLGFDSSLSLGQSTGYQSLASPVGNGNDESTSGTLYLFSPSSTTFVKHFICTSNVYHASNYTVNTHMAGYGNTTSAVDAIQFKMSADEIQGGSISLYGIG